MRKLSSTGLKYLKFIHLLFTAMWVGGIMALLVVLLLTNPITAEAIYTRFYITKIIDDYVIIPGAITVVLTGLVYSIWSRWGFFKHRWLTVKWIIAVFMVFLGVKLGDWVNNNVYTIETINNYLTNQTEVKRNLHLTIAGSITQLVCLLIAIWISVQKPWRKTNN